MESSNLISKEKVDNYLLKSSNKFNNIKADYFLQKIFNNLKKKRALNMVKSNKNIMKRININNNDYKQYS